MPRATRSTEQRLAAAQDQVARLRSRLVSESRKADAHRKIELGGLVIASGAADLDPAVLVGALLRVLPTLDAPAGNELRERFRQIGIAHMQARKAAQQK
jgi:hypothetical protein